jgi:hypothetical protein
VIYNNYSELSPCICDYDAGWTLDPEDEEALDAVVDEVLDHPERVATRKNNAQRLIRERLTWDITIRPLLEFCRKPYRRTRETSLIDQSITPLDDRVGRLMLDMKRSSVYKKLKAWRNGK